MFRLSKNHSQLTVFEKSVHPENDGPETALEIAKSKRFLARK